MSETAFARPEVGQDPEQMMPYQEALGAVHNLLQPYVDNNEV